MRARLQRALVAAASCARDIDARIRLRLPVEAWALAMVATGPLMAATTLALAIEGCGPRHARPAVVPHGAEASVALAPTSLAASPLATVVSPAAPTGPAIEVRLTAYGLAEETTCGGGRSAAIRLHRCDGSELAAVNDDFARQLRMQGSGRLCDGRVVGVRKLAPLCFGEAPNGMPWGATSSGRAATPWRSIAVDPATFALGRWYYLAPLDGREIPGWGATRHDGCVHADDTGLGVRGPHVDLFIGPLASESLGLIRTLAKERVTLAEAELRCARR